MIGFRIKSTTGINHFQSKIIKILCNFKFKIIFNVGYGYNLVCFDVIDSLSPKM